MVGTGVGGCVKVEISLEQRTDLCRWTVGEMSAKDLRRCNETEKNNSA